MAEKELFTHHYALVYADIASFGRSPLARYVGLAGASGAALGILQDAISALHPADRLGPRDIREKSMLNLNS